SVEGVESGVIINAIIPNGPSANSDLEPADVIIAVDGKAVSSVMELKNEIRLKEIGKPMILDLVRDGKKIKISVKPGQLPENNFALHRIPKKAASEFKNLGLTVKALTADLADEYGVERTEGVIVTGIEAGSLAESRRIKAGDVITKVNRRGVAT